MAKTFAFDIYGTLIDPMGISVKLSEYVDRKTADEMAQLLRQKQLEYSFRRAAMGAYRPFSEVTLSALDYSCRAFGIDIPHRQLETILETYNELPAFDDALTVLENIKSSEAKAFAFSNGTSKDIRKLLQHAKMDHLLEGVVSADKMKTFKPSPAIYDHFNTVTHSEPQDTWLISSNPFDVIGASARAWNTVWIRRDTTVTFDPWEHSPTVTMNSLKTLSDIVD